MDPNTHSAKSEITLLEELIDDAGLMSNQAPIIELYNHLKNTVFSDLRPDMIRLTSSSGSSVVLLLNDVSHPFVYQYYRCRETYQNIILMQDRIKNNVSRSLTQTFVDGTNTVVRRKIQYDVTDHLTMMTDHFPTLQTIVWERIKPLHDLPTNTIKPQINQLIWDLVKALYGLHACGYSHGDSRYDNIGLKNGKFVLFDYNLSKWYGNDEHDFELLSRSLEFNLEFSMKLDSFAACRSFLKTLPAVLCLSPDELLDQFERNDVQLN